MIATETLPLAEIEQRVCDLASEHLGISRHKISTASRLIEDLGCDSLDLFELFLNLEDTFAVTLPTEAPNSIYKAVFTRQPFRLSDLAEMVYLQQGTGTPEWRSWWQWQKTRPSLGLAVPFTQLGGVWKGLGADERLLEPVTSEEPAPQFRRRSDGMRCVLIPSASVEIGCDGPEVCPDEKPLHVVHLGAFLIDTEPVSTTAYCRFLNSAGPVAAEVLADWFVLDPQDDRNEHMVIAKTGQEWQPIRGG